jgi:hypothetical protein
MTDEIIQEVWRAKDQLAQQFDYNLDALAAALKIRQQQTGRTVVNLAKDRVRQPAQSPQ